MYRRNKKIETGKGETTNKKYSISFDASTGLLG